VGGGGGVLGGGVWWGGGGGVRGINSSSSSPYQVRTAVESRFGPKRGFRVTPGELLTISKPNPYPKSEKPPAGKGSQNQISEIPSVDSTVYADAALRL